MGVKEIKEAIAECRDADSVLEVANAAFDRYEALVGAEAPPKNQRFSADPAATANPGTPLRRTRRNP